MFSQIVSSRARAAMLVLIACGSGACYATAEAEPGYVETSAPVDIETSPQYVYEGEPVYYSHDHWYRRHNNSWVYYRNEPEELHRHRTHVQPAPRAPAREPERVHHAERAPEHAHEAPRRPEREPEHARAERGQ